ncbi:ComEC family competence protein [Patescibacteria group bacterium]|nr:ComEC family competence protein [Patescibacteria group bacterium]
MINLSKIIFYSILFFIFGIAWGSFLSVPFFIYPSIFLFILIFLFLIKPKYLIKNIWLVVFVLSFFIFGLWRYQISFDQINEDHISFYNGENILFQGKIVKEPDVKVNKTNLIIDKIVFKNKNTKGKILVFVPLYSHYQLNDLLQIECKLEQPKPIEDFNYHEYLARYDIYSMCGWAEIKVLEKGNNKGVYSKILWFKNKTENSINIYFTEPQGSFISASLLGLKRQVPQEVRDWFSRSGISHILAISGLHISILAQLIMIFCTSVLLIRRQKAFWPTLIIIILFVFLAGAPASAVRAAIMGLGLIWTQKIGRPQAGKRIIIYTAAIMLLINPKLLKVDIGFQLSFMAVFGLSLLPEYFNQFFQKIPNFRIFPFRQYLSTTLSAQIFVLPLVLYYFGNLSLIAPLTNVLVLSVMPLIMTLGFLFALAGLIHFWLAKIVFYPLWLLLTAIILIAKIGANIPGLSFIFADFPLFLVIILYILIIFWLVKIKKNEHQKI